MNPLTPIFPRYVPAPKEPADHAQPDGPGGECDVAAGLSPSFSPSGVSVFKLGLVLIPVVAGGRAPAQANTAAPAAGDPAMQRLADYVGLMRASGKVDLAFIGERHWLPENLPMVTAAWGGALETGLGEAVLYRELGKNNAGHEDTIATALRDPARRAAVGGSFANVIARGEAKREPRTPDEIGAARRFQEVMSHPNASLEVLCFYNPHKASLPRVIREGTRFALASVGFTHAEHVPTRKDHNRDPVTGAEMRIPERAYDVSVVGQARQNEMFGGLQQAQDAGKAAIYIASTSVQRRDGQLPRAPARQREQFFAHYLGEGLAILELPSEKGFNITVTVPASVVQESQDFVKLHPGKAFIACGDLPGCEPSSGPERHGDL